MWSKLSAVIGLAVAVTLWLPISGQTQNRGAYKAPFVSGKPDLQGIWFTESGAAAWDVEEHPAGQGILAGPSIVVDPPDKKIPYQPWALAKRKDLIDHHAYDDPQAHCYASGVPRVSYAPFGLEIVQPPGYVLILYENFHLYRNIPIDSGSKLPSSMKLFMGDSHGHWDGGTLVVDVTNQNGRAWLDMAANFTSDTLHVVERYKRIADGTIAYEATLDDPAVYTRPWKMAFTMRRETKPGYQLLELACWEGEQDLEHYTEDQGGKKK
jgi:hypothetical protein